MSDHQAQDPPLQFDAQGNMVDVQGNIIVPHRSVDQYFSAFQRDQQRQQQQQQQQRSRQRQAQFRGLDPTGHMTHHQQQQHPSRRCLSPSPARTAQPQHSTSASVSASASAADQHLPVVSASASGAGLSLAVPGTNTAAQLNAYSSCAQPAPAYVAASVHAASGNWLPQESHAHTWLTSSLQQPGLVFDPAHSQHPLLPPRTPTIRVTTDWPTVQDFSQPQDAIYSASSAGSSLPQNDYPHVYNPYPSHPGGHLSPQSYSMHQERETMQTPVSPVSADHHHHDSAMGDDDDQQQQQQQQQQISRKRSHSVMSQQSPSIVQNAHHSRSGSIASAMASPNDGVAEDGEGAEPRGSRAFKRTDPPTSVEGKYICTFAEECIGLKFDRKCEWSKHMDKHDRPYRCQHAQCAKLQGFTYSGGLLRHEREVHGKHGGPKATMRCPHQDCKRHTGKGFTRKENLNEHLRRVHAGNDRESQQSATQGDGTDMADDGETQLSSLAEPVHQDPGLLSSPLKRKRSLPLTAGGEIVEDPAKEIKRLRAMLQHRDEVIRQLEQALDIQSRQEPNTSLDNDEARALFALEQHKQSQSQLQSQQQPQLPEAES